MRMIYVGLLMFMTTLCCQAEPPVVPKEIKATPGQLVRITVKTDKKIGNARNFTDADGFFGELVAPTGQRQFVFQPPLQGAKSSYVLSFWTEGELEGSTCTIIVEGILPPIPVPPTPSPTPTPTPSPSPVTSYRVIWVYESASTLTPTQNSVLYAKSITDYLNTYCTKDNSQSSWRRFDKDTTATNDNSVMKSLWSVVKPSITTVPCLVIEVNGRATILPFPVSVDDALNTLKKYNSPQSRGGN